jgi:hypothetical protein
MDWSRCPAAGGTPPDPATVAGSYLACSLVATRTAYARSPLQCPLRGLLLHSGGG